MLEKIANTATRLFEKLTNAGLWVSDVVVLIDRQSGAKEALAEKGFHMHAIFTLSQLLDIWEADDRVPAEKIAETRRFLSQSG